MRGFNEASRREVARRLRDYFLSDGAVSGIQSIHGPLVDMALAGGGIGTRDPERSINGRRFGRFGFANEHRTIRESFANIDSAHRNTLAAAYGHQRRWHPQVVRALKHALPEEFRDAFGAALLVPRVQHGLNTRAELVEHRESLETDEPVCEATKRRRKAKSVPGLLVWSPPASMFKQGEDGHCEMDAIGEQAADMLRKAHKAFAVALADVEQRKRAAR